MGAACGVHDLRFEQHAAAQVGGQGRRRRVLPRPGVGVAALRIHLAQTGRERREALERCAAGGRERWVHPRKIGRARPAPGPAARTGVMPAPPCGTGTDAYTSAHARQSVLPDRRKRNARGARAPPPVRRPQQRRDLCRHPAQPPSRRRDPAGPARRGRRARVRSRGTARLRCRVPDGVAAARLRGRTGGAAAACVHAGGVRVRHPRLRVVRRPAGRGRGGRRRHRAQEAGWARGRLRPTDPPRRRPGASIPCWTAATPPGTQPPSIRTRSRAYRAAPCCWQRTRPPRSKRRRCGQAPACSGACSITPSCR